MNPQPTNHFAKQFIYETPNFILKILEKDTSSREHTNAQFFEAIDANLVGFIVVPFSTVQCLGRSFGPIRRPTPPEKGPKRGPVAQIPKGLTGTTPQHTFSR